jgi:hypothetical protein
LKGKYSAAAPTAQRTHTDDALTAGVARTGSTAH